MHAMKGWVLLDDRDQWDGYKRTLAGQLNINAGTTHWGNGPQSFPCLVASYVVPGAEPARVASCYVYRGDAKRLLGLDEQPPQPEPAPADKAMSAFLESMSAHILALVEALVSVGVTSEERYEEKYQHFLKLAGEIVAERKLSVEDVLKRLHPTTDEG